MAEKIVGPMLFDNAKKYLVELMDETGAFRGGSRPYVGRLKRSYGYNKIIGCKSFDNQVTTRIDYDKEKGYHFNFQNFNTKEKVCILIADMSKAQYQRYIDNLTTGRSTEVIAKGPIIRYRKGTNERIYYQQFDSILNYISKEDQENYIISKDLKDFDYETVISLLFAYYKKQDQLELNLNDILEINTYNDEFIVFDRFYFDYLIELAIIQYEEKKEPLTKEEIALTRILHGTDAENIYVSDQKRDELKEKIRQAKQKVIDNAISYEEKNKRHRR